MTRIWLPSDIDLDPLWAMVSTDSLSVVELHAWHDNQLRAAMLRSDQLKQFIHLLPAPQGLSQQLMTFSGHLIPIDPASTAASHQPASVTIRGKTAVYGRGRMELMIAANPQADGRIKLTIVPHQYVPRPMLLPRSHFQAALDGPLFLDLQLRVLMGPADVLVIAPDLPSPHFDDTRPPPDSPSPDASPAGGPAGKKAGSQALDKGSKTLSAMQPAAPSVPATQPVNQPLVLPPLSNDTPVLPYGLGRAILTGVQQHVHLHQLWILQIQPLDSTQVEHGSPAPAGPRDANDL
jgi:hypothetical protein